MGASKSPSRVLDGPYANWDVTDENAIVSLANGSTLFLGQPLCIDVTQLGPDNNVPNNAAALPQAEYLVATTSANAGPVFGVLTNIPGPPSGITLSTVSGVPQWKNTSGSTLAIKVQVRQQGWGYVYCGAAAIGQTGGNSILVGSNIITTSAQVWAIQGSSTIASNVGIALATAINTTMATPGAAQSAGVISVQPNSMVDIVPNTLLLIDSLQSGVQEQVSVGSISGGQFKIAITNAHPAGFKITGPNVAPAKSSVLISTPGTGLTQTGLVATWINVFA